MVDTSEVGGIISSIKFLSRQQEMGFRVRVEELTLDRRRELCCKGRKRVRMGANSGVFVNLAV